MTQQAASITYHICDEGNFHVELQDRTGTVFAAFTLSEEQALQLCDVIDGYFNYCQDDDIDTIGETAGSA